MKTVSMADGDGSESESELAPCPYCGGTECAHEVLWHARDNHDWYGKLPAATADLDERLLSAVMALLKAGVAQAPRGSTDAFGELLAEAAQVFDPASGELDDTVRTWGYWIALADAVDESFVVEVHWDSGQPGGDDTFVHAFFRNPNKGINEVLAAATADLAKLSSPRKKRRVARKSR